MIPGYTEKLSEHLGIVKERVAIRGQEVMQAIEFEMDNARKDAMMVTPIGICLSYYEMSNNFIFVEFNGERIKLYDNGKLSVTDAAMQLQFPNEDLFPKRGKALLFTVNGKSRMSRGILGEAAVIKVNGDPADMYTQVHNGDKITVTPSTAGEPATLELGKLPELSEQLHVYVNGQKMDLSKNADVNGSRQNEYYQIQENDDIHISSAYTVREIAEILDVPLGGDIRVNDTPAQADTKVYENFTVSWDMTAVTEMAVDVYEETEADEEEVFEDTAIENAASEQNGNMAEEAASNASETKTVNEAPRQEAATEKQETEPVPSNLPRPMTVIVNHKPITMQGKAQYVYVDVFDYIEFDLTPVNGRSIVTQLNGRPAEFMENLKDGDVIDIYWKQI